MKAITYQFTSTRESSAVGIRSHCYRWSDGEHARHIGPAGSGLELSRCILHVVRGD